MEVLSACEVRENATTVVSEFCHDKKAILHHNQIPIGCQMAETVSLQAFSCSTIDRLGTDQLGTARVPWNCSQIFGQHSALYRAVLLAIVGLKFAAFSPVWQVARLTATNECVVAGPRNEVALPTIPSEFGFARKLTLTVVY